MKRITEAQIRQVIREELNEVLGLGKLFNKLRGQPQAAPQAAPQLGEVEVVDEQQLKAMAQEFADNFFDMLENLAKENNKEGANAVLAILSSPAISANVDYANPTQSIFGFIDGLKRIPPGLLGKDKAEMDQIINQFESSRKVEGLQVRILKKLQADYNNNVELQTKLGRVDESKKKLKR